jgi:hypothetical protein
MEGGNDMSSKVMEMNEDNKHSKGNIRRCELINKNDIQSER